MGQIRAIEAEYNGYRFRSRLEARWAVFFDALGVEYEYEPEGFELPSGKRYLPDFRVKCYGTRGNRDAVPFDLYIEVKGRMTQKDADKVLEFVGMREVPAVNPDDSIFCCFEIPENPTLIVGNIPREGCSSDSYSVGAYDPMDGIGIYPFNYETIDGDHFAAYPAAHRGKFYLWGDDGNYINGDDIPSVESAYRIARQARFEHGETPSRRSVQRRMQR